MACTASGLRSSAMATPKTLILMPRSRRMRSRRHTPRRLPYSNRLGQHAALPRHRRKAGIGQHRFGAGIAMQDAQLGAAFVVERDLHGDARIARPVRIDHAGAVADQVAGIAAFVHRSPSDEIVRPTRRALRLRIGIIIRWVGWKSPGTPRNRRVQVGESKSLSHSRPREVALGKTWQAIQFAISQIRFWSSVISAPNPMRQAISRRFRSPWRRSRSEAWRSRSSADRKNPSARSAARLRRMVAAMSRNDSSGWY